MTPRRALALTVAAAAAIRFGAYASEIWGGLIPCALCLVERWPYNIAVGIGLIGLALPVRFARWTGALLLLTFLAGAGAGLVHVGVEQRWWPSPLPECRGPDLHGLSIAQRLAALPLVPSKACEDPSFLIPGIPISLAGFNLLLSLYLAAFVGRQLVFSPRPR
jgi:disulfide bond formation protein DsbB